MANKRAKEEDEKARKSQLGVAENVVRTSINLPTMDNMEKLAKVKPDIVKREEERERKKKEEEEAKERAHREETARMKKEMDDMYFIIRNRSSSS